VSQSNAELSVYQWPQWPLQDALRREYVKELETAINYYKASIILDAANATANRRLGQIELSLGQYDEACRHLSVAYAVQPYQRATRQLVGECYAFDDDVHKAAELWRTMDLSAGQLTDRVWWYANYLGDSIRADEITRAMVLLGQD
jgi:tetratricopeptide (TPR) repeat protein